MLKHNQPASYLLSPAVYDSLLQRLNADLRLATQEDIDSGPAGAAEEVFSGSTARYAEADSKPATKISVKRPT